MYKEKILDLFSGDNATTGWSLGAITNQFKAEEFQEVIDALNELLSSNKVYCKIDNYYPKDKPVAVIYKRLRWIDY